MALNSASLFIFALLLTLLSSKTYGYHRLGGVEPIKDLNDPGVVEKAQFAVAEHNKMANTTLVFVKIVKGAYQVVAGIKYDLVISAKDGNSTIKTHNAVVLDKMMFEDSLVLLSFK